MSDLKTGQTNERRAFGVRQAWVLMIGFWFIPVAIGFVAALVWGGVFGVIDGVRQGLGAVESGDAGMPSIGLGVAVGLGVGAYLIAAGWAVRYVVVRAAGRLGDRSVRGVGWCSAGGWFYRLAVGLAGLTVVMVWAVGQIPMFHQRGGLVEEVWGGFARAGWSRWVYGVVFVGVAPLVDEWVFRGGALAALASRYRVWVSGATVTGCYLVVHAPRELTGVPGFVGIVVLAAVTLWLRVRSGSVRPAMLFHVVYNVGLVGLAVWR